tara:strand:- start:120 stop:257 length:138 start_codon:yes stop_codon:yes gene_type:complete
VEMWKKHPLKDKKDIFFIYSPIPLKDLDEEIKASSKKQLRLDKWV